MAKKEGVRSEYKVCVGCSKKVNLKKDHYVCVSTINRKSHPDDFAYFHFECWVDYFNDRVNKMAKHIVATMRDQALMVANNPMIKQALMEVPNFQQVLNMLNIPLTEKDKVKQTMDNGRKKSKTKSSK